MIEDLIKEYLVYDPETGDLTWLKSRSNRIKPGDKVRGKDSRGYLRVYIGGKSLKAHRVAWFLMTGHWPKGVIDHIDGDPSNNRWENLREATVSQNMANRSADSGRPFKGVYRHNSKTPSWFARIVVKGKPIYLGSYPSQEAAAKAYDKAAIRHFGPFAHLNFNREENHVVA